MKKFIAGLVMLSLLFSSFLLNIPISFAQKKYGESPILSDLVKQGKLPPVDQRLPEEPYVVKEGVDIQAKYLKPEIGKYGGTLRTLTNGGEWWGMTRDQLVSQPGLGEVGKKPIGGIFKDFDMSKDAKVFTFHLRKGMKWSDGEPLTTEDVRFAYEDVLLNKELTPVFPTWLANTDGTPCKVEIVDKYTFRLSFKESYGLFPYTLSLRWRGWDEGPLLQPSHYMKQFHIKYTPLEKLQPLLRKNNLGDKEWARLYNLYSWGGGSIAETKIGCPTLAAYVLTEMPSPQTFIATRNPYYWKVDAVGNQLPYIDYIRGETLPRPEMIPLKIIGGEVDWSFSGSLKDLPLYKENEKKGGYKTVLCSGGGATAITFNYSHPDKVWRKIIWDKRFREALNLAMNRKEIIDSLYNGLAEPVKLIHGEYNPAKANQLLDSMGLNKRDSEGWRLRPDGKRMELLIETSGAGADWIPLCELLVEYWKNIGIYTTMKRVDSSLLNERVRANQTQVLVNSWLDIIVIRNNPYMIDWVLINDPNKLSIGFYDWFTSGGKKGLEPPASFKPIYTLYQKMRSSRNFTEIKKYLETWEKVMHDTLFLLLPVENGMSLHIFSEKLGNCTPAGEEIPQWHAFYHAAKHILYFK